MTMGKDRLICNGVTYTGDDLLSGNCFIGNSIAGDELAIDTLTATVRSQGISLTGLPYGTPVFYYHGDTLIGKFYLNAVARSSRDNYDLSCVSGVGLLDALPHYGGLYAGETMEDVLADIIGSVVPYTVTPGIKTVRVYGWLPVATRRDNLRQLLFAVGASLKKDTAGEISIGLLSVSAPADISDDRLLSGGTVEYAAAISEVVVLEHGYISTASDEEVTLYDESVTGQELVSPKGEPLNGVLVTFDGPVYGLSAEGGTILESGVNYAILAPSGQTTLKGKKYTHTTREVYAAAEGATGEKNVARVEDATLVNITNSEAVAKRVASYYSVSRKIRMGMVVGPERPGDAVTLNDPFDEPATGLLMSQDINMSNTLVAQAEMIAGYVPEHDGVYEHVVVLTGSGTWTPPAGVKKIHVVLIGGGLDGTDGEDGKAGGSTSLWVTSNQSVAGYSKTVQPGAGGTGGTGGTGGAGGNILQKTLEVSAEVSLNYRAGSAGGEDSIFGSLTSADGTPSKTGYIDIFSGTAYGVAGIDGLNGGDGGNGGAYSSEGEDGKPAGDYAGGSGGKSGRSNFGPYTIQHGGHGGGGGAYKAEDSAYPRYGKNAAPASRVTALGCGGNGGSGGGGGGGAYGARITFSSNFPSGVSENFPGGAAGTGAAGTPGAPGCILVYY